MLASSVAESVDCDSAFDDEADESAGVGLATGAGVPSRTPRGDSVMWPLF